MSVQSPTQSPTPSAGPIALSQHSLLDPPHDLSFRPRDTQPSTAVTPPIREILACLDGSDLGCGVLPHAQLVAQALGARLSLLQVLETDTGAVTRTAPTDPLDWGIRRREARAKLDRAVAQIDESDLKVRSELLQGRPAEQICSWAENNEIDLTVLCSHGARGVTEWDLASTARKLIDKVPGSLFLVPGTVASQHREVWYRRILVPLDGSPRAESAIPIAMRIAAAEDAEVIFVHVVSTPEMIRLGPLDAEGSDLERRVIDYNQRVATAYLDRLRAQAARCNSRVRARVVIDDNARLKLERMIQEEDVDLVVMSAHGQTCRTDSACGSVTEYALAHATVPLLVLRERVGRQVRRVMLPTSRSEDRTVPGGPAAQ